VSKEKVDRYKASKANRKQEVKKEKRMRLLERVAITVVALVLVVWLGSSLVSVYKEHKPYPEYTIDYAALSDYSNSLNATEEESEEASDDTEEKTGEATDTADDTEDASAEADKTEE
jgi:hypothetical protein